MQHFENGDSLCHTAKGLNLPVTYIGPNPARPKGRPWGEHIIQGASGNCYVASDDYLYAPKTLSDIVDDTVHVIMNALPQGASGYTQVFHVNSVFGNMFEATVKGLVKRAIREAKIARG